MIHSCVEANFKLSTPAIRFKFCRVGHEPASTENGQFNMETIWAGRI